MNIFEVFDQLGNPKETLVGDFISVCLNDPTIEIFVRYDELTQFLVITIHTNGEVLKEERIKIKKVFG